MPYSIPSKEQTDVYCFLSDLNQISGFNNCTPLLTQCQTWNLKSEDTNRCFSRLKNSTFSAIIRLYQYCHYFDWNMKDKSDAALKQILGLDLERPPLSMGLLTGYAGEGMMRLTALNQTDLSWIYLL